MLDRIKEKLFKRRDGHSIVISATGIAMGATKVSGMAAPTVAGDALRKGTRLGKGDLEWTLNKLLKGAGAGADPTEIDVPTAGATTIRKTADETVNNSDTLQNDDHLFFAVAINEVWEYTIVLMHVGNSTADIKVLVTAPSGATNIYTILGPNTNDIFQLWQSQSEPGTPRGLGASTYVAIHYIRGVITNGGTAGNVQFQWAQNIATVVDTIVKANSCIIAHKLN